MGTTAQARIIQILSGRQEQIAKADLDESVKLVRSVASLAVKPNRETAMRIDNGEKEIDAVALLARHVTQRSNKVALYILYSSEAVHISGTIL